MKPIPGHELKHLRVAFQVGDRVSVTFPDSFVLFGCVIGIKINHIDTPELRSTRYLLRWDFERSEGWNAWHGEEIMKREFP